MADDIFEHQGEDEKGRDRSPPFPFIPLGKAIERAKQFEAAYKKAPGRIANVLPIWDYTPKSSGGFQTIGALKAYGLIDDEGSGADRKIKLTDLAMRILKDERPGKRDEAIKEAALKPRAIADHWKLWGATRPPDAECRSELTLERGYTEDAASRLLRVYDDTVKYAKLAETDSHIDKEKKVEEKSSRVNVGDFVQWEPAGVLQFPEPKQVVKITEGGNFVFVDGSATGLPANEVVVVRDGESSIDPAKPPAVTGLQIRQAAPGVRQDVWNLDEGPVVLSYPAKMSAPSFEDFESWISLQLRKIKRGIEQ